MFFSEREKWAYSFKNEYTMTTFCAVERSLDHPLRPTNYKPLDEFWKMQGFQKHNQMRAEFKWLDCGEAAETIKKMTFWTKQMKELE